VTRAIPLLHVDTHSSIYAEVAIEHVEAYAEREGLSVVGIFEAGTQAGDSGLSRAARGVLKGLKAKDEVFALTVCLICGSRSRPVDDRQRWQLADWTGRQCASRQRRGSIHSTPARPSLPAGSRHSDVSQLYLASDPSRSLPSSTLSPSEPDLPRRTLALIRNRAKSGQVPVYDFDAYMEDGYVLTISSKYES
jgi:hypothetical protein